MQERVLAKIKNGALWVLSILTAEAMEIPTSNACISR
jgi:hypothetical protein